MKKVLRIDSFGLQSLGSTHFISTEYLPLNTGYSWYNHVDDEDDTVLDKDEYYTKDPEGL